MQFREQTGPLAMTLSMYNCHHKCLLNRMEDRFYYNRKLFCLFWQQCMRCQDTDRIASGQQRINCTESVCHLKGMDIPCMQNVLNGDQMWIYLRENATSAPPVHPVYIIQKTIYICAPVLLLYILYNVPF